MARERIGARQTKDGPWVVKVTRYSRAIIKVWESLLPYKDMYYIRFKYDRKSRKYLKIDINYPLIRILSLD